MISVEGVFDSLSVVKDPELDEPITELGFVGGIEIANEDEVSVELRLPTYFCAPNFAYLMAADARAAVLAVPGVRLAHVRLADHFASDEINSGVEGLRGFEDAFEGLADGGLEDLRGIFERKAFLVRQERLARILLRDGRELGSVVALTLGQVEASSEREAYLERRQDLGISIEPHEPFLVDPAGRPIAADEVAEHLRFARTVRLSVEGNAGLCRSLLATRYGVPDPEEATA